MKRAQESTCEIASPATFKMPLVKHLTIRGLASRAFKYALHRPDELLPLPLPLSPFPPPPPPPPPLGGAGGFPVPPVDARACTLRWERCTRATDVESPKGSAQESCGHSHVKVSQTSGPLC
eukprot:840124-Pyramimonas_sp.AAC.1